MRKRIHKLLPICLIIALLFTACGDNSEKNEYSSQQQSVYETDKESTSNTNISESSSENKTIEPESSAENKPTMPESTQGNKPTAPESTQGNKPTIPESGSANRPTEPDITKKSIDEIMAGMSLEEKVGQMFMINCLPSERAATVKAYHPGGYVLFASDFENETPGSIKGKINNWQQDSNIKLLIAVDEEGGKVNRISLFKQFRAEPFKSSQVLYREGGWSLIESDAQEKARLLKSLGVNLNLAPVCDVAESGNYIFERTFGSDAALTSSFVSKVTTVMKRENVGVTLKHFPGYGNSKDTHKGMATDTREYKEFKEKDFLPFEAGIKAGAGSVMVSHNIVTCMDADYPASLSPKVHQELRNTLGFKGVIITDDLSMGAIAEFLGGNHEKVAIQAIKAGNDFLCTAQYRVQIPAVINAVKNGEISEARINESVRRILEWKRKLGLI